MLIREATTPEDLDIARGLFREYEQELGEDLCFQGFEEELATLPGKYGPPAGSLLLAWEGDEPLGCVALRPLTDSTCEMKRLYVRPSGRGQALGRKLSEAIVEEGRRKGYEKIVLDTLDKLTAAIALYKGMGFVEIEPYYENPLPRVVYLSLDLT